MPSIHYWKNSNDTMTYFFSDERTNQVGEPLWAGKTIQLLRESRHWPDTVDADHLGALLDGIYLERSPAIGRNCASDFIFTAPKDVSIYAALTSERERDGILATHVQAVRKAMDDLEDLATAQIARDVAEGLPSARGRGRLPKEAGEYPQKNRKSRERGRIRTHNIPAALFTHFIARLEDEEPDPNIHTHCLIPRITQRPDGGWGTLDIQVQIQDIFAVDQTYRKYLLNGLRQKDIQVAMDAQYGMIVEGITEDVRRAFSMRSSQIRNHAHGDNASDDLAELVAKRRQAAIQTREGKSEHPWDYWLPSWRRRALQVVAGDDLESMERLAMTDAGQSALVKIIGLVETQRGPTSKPERRR